MDITERKNAQAKMEHMAHHDALTNLPNRVQLVKRLELEVRRAERHGYCGAVLFIDLDQFKNINDSLDRKSTRLNSSHVAISYAVFCLKKKIRSSATQNAWVSS